jgi:bifunctional DNase/RNase
LAVRFGCPIYVYENILDQAGVASEHVQTETPTPIENKPINKGTDLSSLTLSELNDLLNEVLEQEDYIKAIDIRDEIAKRNASKK